MSAEPAVITFGNTSDVIGAPDSESNCRKRKQDDLLDEGSAGYYKKYVKQILAVPVLADAIDEIDEEDARAVNLVDENWLTILDNTLVMKNHLNKQVKIKKYDSRTKKNIIQHRVVNFSDSFNVIVVGYFNFNKDGELGKTRLRVVDCRPLQVIGEVLANQCGGEIMHNAKFFLHECQGNCNKCRGYNLNKNSWCIKTTKAYDGESLSYVDQNYCETLFRQPTMGIAHFEINGVYSFNKDCKVNGNLKTIIFIEDKSLTKSERMTKLKKIDILPDILSDEKSLEVKTPKPMMLTIPRNVEQLELIDDQYESNSYTMKMPNY